MRRIEAFGNTIHFAKEARFVSNSYSASGESEFTRKDFHEFMLEAINGLLTQSEHLQNSAQALVDQGINQLNQLNQLT